MLATRVVAAAPAVVALLVLLAAVVPSVRGQAFTAVEIADDGGAVKLGASLDTVLYRSSANTLTTPGKVAAGTLEVTAGTTTLRGATTVTTGGLSVTGPTVVTGDASVSGDLSVAGVTKNSNYPKRSLRRVASAKLMSMSTDDVPFQTFASSAPAATSPTGYSMINTINWGSKSQLDAWDTQWSYNKDTSGADAMWKGAPGVANNEQAAFGPQSAVCIPPYSGSTELGRGIYLITAHVNLGGCGSIDNSANALMRILGLAYRYASEPGSIYVGPSSTRWSANGQNAVAMTVVDQMLLGPGDCVFATVRHNCYNPGDGNNRLTLVRPFGNTFTPGVGWSVTPNGYAASLAVTYLGTPPTATDFP